MTSHDRAGLALPLAPEESDFTSGLRSRAVTARVGTWLGIAFGLAFLTGLYSHYVQDPVAWFPLTRSPAWFYRVTQGVHVVSGTVAVPLLLVKLWSVYPKLFARLPWPPSKTLVLHLLERLSIGLLVAAAVFQLVTGLANSAQWYPWSFGFRAAHFAVAFVAIGSVLLHVAVKWPLIRAGYRTPTVPGAGGDYADPEGPVPAGDGGRAPVLTRRGLLRTTWLAGAVALLATAGSTVPLLRRVSVFGVRSGDGPQGVPVNRSARAAGVMGTADAPGWMLTVVRGDTQKTFTLAQLEAMRQSTHSLPIACVEGWSAGATWTGVPLRDLVAQVGAPPGSAVKVLSLQTRGSYGTSEVPSEFTADGRTLLALRLHGEPLDIDHGYPARLISPARPGVLQTKWVTRLEVL